jgi:uncharacterized protein involved in exopolysaccharide biosynthesis
MSIFQFCRILWAYRVLTLLTCAATVVGAVLAILVIPPSYEARTRVMLNIMKPDAVTGETMGSDRDRTYIDTQRELIADFGVAGHAVDQLGWVYSEDTLKKYIAAGSPAGGVRHWLAQQIIDRTKAEQVGDSNILEISFRASSPEDASAMANALRNAYVETLLSGRRAEAMRNAEWFTQQADKEKEMLAAAEQERTAYERQTGIVMADDKTDIETARLRALSAQTPAGTPLVAAASSVSSPAAVELARLDAQIAEASRTLGANHPAMIEMKARRSALAKMVADDRGRAGGDGAGALNRALAAQTSRVVARGDKIERLTQLQAAVNLHQAQMGKSLARAAELRQEAAVADAGVTVLGEAFTPLKPAFPNKPLILGGAIVLGAGIGLLLSLILEMIGRRIRGSEDLLHAIDVPLLAVVPFEVGPNSAPQLPPSAQGRFLPPNRRAASA